MLLGLSTSAYCTPVSFMDDYRLTNLTTDQFQEVSDSIRTSFRGKDFYRISHVVAYEMHENFEINSGKIFIHFTNKWNRELDELGNLGRFGQRYFNGERYGLTEDETNAIRHNLTWDYHVAPFLLVNNEEVVLERNLQLPYNLQPNYTPEEAFELSLKDSSIQEWVEALTVRGEILWKARRRMLLRRKEGLLSEIEGTNRPRIRRTLRARLVQTENMLERLGMNGSNETIDIRCREATNMAMVDAGQETEWCFYSKTPMYYYNQIDLREVTYGADLPSEIRYVLPVPRSFHTDEYFEAGHVEKVLKSRFDEAEVRSAYREVR
tara:strand:- start:4561 stop:5526 length:966 start_codon:yes stop_codon:yes gene_type:complete